MRNSGHHARTARAGGGRLHRGRWRPAALSRRGAGLPGPARPRLGARPRHVATAGGGLGRPAAGDPLRSTRIRVLVRAPSLAADARDVESLLRRLNLAARGGPRHVAGRARRDAGSPRDRCASGSLAWSSTARRSTAATPASRKFRSSVIARSRSDRGARGLCARNGAAIRLLQLQTSGSGRARPARAA